MDGGIEGELRCEIPLLAFEWFLGVVVSGIDYKKKKVPLGKLKEERISRGL